MKRGLCAAPLAGRGGSFRLLPGRSARPAWATASVLPRIESRAFPGIEFSALPCTESSPFPRIEFSALPCTEFSEFHRIEFGALPCTESSAFPRIEFSE